MHACHGKRTVKDWSRWNGLLTCSSLHFSFDLLRAGTTTTGSNRVYLLLPHSKLLQSACHRSCLIIICQYMCLCRLNSIKEKLQGTAISMTLHNCQSCGGAVLGGGRRKEAPRVRKEPRHPRVMVEIEKHVTGNIKLIKRFLKQTVKWPQTNIPPVIGRWLLYHGDNNKEDGDVLRLLLTRYDT